VQPEQGGFSVESDKVKNQKYLQVSTLIIFSVLSTLLYIFLCTGQKLLNGERNPVFFPGLGGFPCRKAGFPRGQFFCPAQSTFLYHSELEIFKFL